MVDQGSPPFIGADAVRGALSMRGAIDAIARALPLVDADAQPARVAAPLSGGQFLLMPSELGAVAGCKVLTVADPERAPEATERIQGVMLLFDARTLAPRAIVDGAALTSLRTPAVSAAIADLVTPTDASTLAVFGTGPQARSHVEAMRAIRPIERVLVVARTHERAAAAAADWAFDGLEVLPADPGIVAEADLIVCATTAARPVLASADVPAHATVVAIGSHEPHRRELPADLLGRSHVVVEGHRVAATEAGDVILAIADGALDEARLLTARDLATGQATVDFDRPRVVKTCGMAWQDVVVAAAVAERAGAPTGGTPA
ncbi:ornithine cyclodeaminase family protein [Agromyces mangrovi Wang et al. 2018]|uniref:ornithine cyclodeaminase family protein n=1 Tax=Agromyces mangrovi TaxID=1858653 RepID=UPI002572E894|nr:ornithine cyclodeaminase family protein [Agromyces mangrovi]